MAKLIFTGKDFCDQVYQLVLDTTSVGRGSSNTLVIHDNSVSIHHCDILHYGSEVIVRDHNSTNGSFINDVRITGQAPVKSGQTIRFGSVEARLELDLPDSTDLASDHTAVRAHSRAVRDLRRAKAAPKPEAVIDPSSLSPPADQTVIMPRPSSPPVSSRPAQEEAPAKGTGSKRVFWLAAAAVIALGLIILAYALLGSG